MMQRGAGSGGGARNLSGLVRKAHLCVECGKSFRTGEDLFLHAEMCLLDAFEMEASAVQGLGNSEPRGLVLSADPKTTSLKRSLPGNLEAPGLTTMGSTPTRSSDQLLDVAPKMSPMKSFEKHDLSGDLTLGAGECEDEVDEAGGDSDYEPPPELEPAEPPPPKKNKRVFPIGDDGKQIRPKMECPTCGLILYRHNFSTHFRIHTGELPFQCSFCEKRFRTSSALTVHTRCHTGERPYECPNCNYCCITKRNLDRHIINNHVKKSSRAAANRMLRDSYYWGRSSVNRSYGSSATRRDFDYPDADDDLYEDDIEDENLDEDELEEEAARLAGREEFPNAQKSQTAEGGETQASEIATPSASAENIAAEKPQDAPKLYPRPSSTVPVLDGPTGVYGDQESDRPANNDQPAPENTADTAAADKDGETQPIVEK